ncbi:MAG TPA: heavy-metal-associated domain-containing protein [Thermoplasmata archaeon]|nr:heavy-metal-associated domain-containing protein [Thermoplasmata archaeon]
MSRVKFRISGMDCATCTKVLEKALAGEPGVKDVVANYVINAAVVEYDPAQTDEVRLREAVESKTSYRVRALL